VPAAMSSAARKRKTFRGKPNRIPGPAEICSASPGLAFALVRIPQYRGDSIVGRSICISVTSVLAPVQNSSTSAGFDVVVSAGIDAETHNCHPAQRLEVQRGTLPIERSVGVYSIGDPLAQSTRAGALEH
jgi:hypothetical protein